ncbi:uncharacterized protein MONOS_11633 [Monocercomonoides exilis]|uniref:uncharacterized protein n=1 Tax=Monocercomonoides exilis TaxID=2049356 RepID=UPI0035593930|nr:hypothetical protein MONOS_11633 [Monocercomonoides exilis]|eukprot:MONOS_11633.1-p1 / transcript=MONOS_11633.1 / gene=MONOS_11633 / organism=Monocercomonoides_exilis_PA203 / gene_product=unspecified product / transcript_product=unspecified product / location=Mono_scaffold00595:25882-26382(-) / protein_length=167 / sequence_SO=supercontig / SO=protein_coding / is_pseudo=false
MRINVKAIHLPGVLNSAADSLSRLERSGDYQITRKGMEEVQKQLNVEIEQDAFASQGNNKAQIWFGSSSLYAEDGLSVSWKYAVTLVHPPVPLILPSMRKIWREKARAVILIPTWRDQIWTPLLKRMITHFEYWKNSQTILQPGPGLKRTGASLSPGGYIAGRLYW